MHHFQNQQSQAQIAYLAKDEPGIFSQNESYNNQSMSILEPSLNRSSKKAINEDLAKLQQRIMGLQMKIKDDEESNKKNKQGHQALRERIRLASPAQSIRLNNTF